MRSDEAPIGGHRRELEAAGPLRRWSYLDPVPKDFVFTGERAFFYEPDNAQVTVFEQFKDSPHADLMFQAQAFGLELGETEDQSRSYVRHALRKLEIARKNREIKSFEDRLNKGELSRDERTQHARMISEVKLLERQLQTDARGSSQ